MWGHEMAPHTPSVRARPGEAGRVSLTTYRMTSWAKPWGASRKALANLLAKIW